MRNDDDRLRELRVLQDDIKSLLNLMLGLRVEGGGRLVQQEDLRLPEESSCDGNALLLPSRELDAALTDERVITVREGDFVLDEIVRVCLLACPIQVVIGHLEPCAVYDILTDRAREEDWLLLHDCEERFVVVRVGVLQVLRTILHTAVMRVVETLDKLNDGRLSAAGGANECDSLVLGDLDFYTAEDLDVLLRWVGELDALELDRTVFDLLIHKLCSAFHGNLGLVEENVGNGGHGAH